MLKFIADKDIQKHSHDLSAKPRDNLFNSPKSDVALLPIGPIPTSFAELHMERLKIANAEISENMPTSFAELHMERLKASVIDPNIKSSLVTTDTTVIPQAEIAAPLKIAFKAKAKMNNIFKRFKLKNQSDSDSDTQSDGDGGVILGSQIPNPTEITPSSFYKLQKQRTINLSDGPSTSIDNVNVPVKNEQFDPIHETKHKTKIPTSNPKVKSLIAPKQIEIKLESPSKSTRSKVKVKIIGIDTRVFNKVFIFKSRNNSLFLV
jgi:hypothetical protein